jgi:hypothetical protein
MRALPGSSSPPALQTEDDGRMTAASHTVERILD